jgi:hypothetical protein
MFARDLNTVKPGTIVIVTEDTLMNREATNEGVPILVPLHGFRSSKDLRDYRPIPLSSPTTRLTPESFSFWNGNVVKIHGGWTQAYTETPSPMEAGEIRDG